MRLRNKKKIARRRQKEEEVNNNTIIRRRIKIEIDLERSFFDISIINQIPKYRQNKVGVWGFLGDDDSKGIRGGNEFAHSLSNCAISG